MRHTHITSILSAAVLAASALMSCQPDFQEDIDGLKDKFSKLDQRVGKLEQQVADINDILGQLSALSKAAEQNFYITEVVTTADGYEITMSNGSKICLRNGPGNTLLPVSSISMTQISGFYYWTLNGLLVSDASGNPIRATDVTPIIKYDYDSGQLLISIDGGVTFRDINVYASVVINETVLNQVINNYFSRHSSTFISQQMLYQVVATYIQQNYSELFNVEVLDEVIAGYIRENSGKIFRYELLEEIFTQYDFEYYTSQIDVDRLVEIIVSFIQEHNEVLMNNEVLYGIISSYISANMTTIFSSDLLLEIISSYIENNQLVIDENMLASVVSRYIDKHSDTVFNTESVKDILMEYVRKYYVQAFSQTILVQLLNASISQNGSTLFNESLMQEIIRNYVENNYSVIITNEMIYSILNEYVEKNVSTLINVDLLTEITANWFKENYDIVIDRTTIEAEFNRYIETHRDTIIDTEIIENILLSYLRWNYRYIFNIDLLSQVVTDYFSSNTEIIKEYVNGGADLIQNVTVEGDKCTVTLSNGSIINLVVYDAYARLRDRVQSIVVVPRDNGCIAPGSGTLTYVVSPASMAPVISDKFSKDEMSMEFLYTDGSTDVVRVAVIDAAGNNKGELNVYAGNLSYDLIKVLALHIKENKPAGTDIMTEFTPVKEEVTPPVGPEAVDLGLKVKWAPYNIGATKPEEYGDYYAWGETDPYYSPGYAQVSPCNYWRYGKESGYVWDSYKFTKDGGNTFTKYCGSDGLTDFSKTSPQYEDDAARVNWGGSWRMPTAEEIEDLMNNCAWAWTDSYNGSGVKGYIVTGTKTGYTKKSIFLPASGFRLKKERGDLGSGGYYWSSSVITDGYTRARRLSFGQGSKFCDANPRYAGFTIRPVRD